MIHKVSAKNTSNTSLYISIDYISIALNENKQEKGLDYLQALCQYIKAIIKLGFVFNIFLMFNLFKLIHI